MAKTVRFIFDSVGGGLGLIARPGVTIIPSSEVTSLPRSSLLRPLPSDVLSFKLGHTFGPPNNKIDFNRGGVKVATIATGTYATPALAVEAVRVALEAADPTPVWAPTYSGGFVSIASDLAFTLLFATGANKSNSAAIDLGFAETDRASATAHLANRASYQSRHAITLDFGPEQIVITPGLNDAMDFNRGGVKVARVEGGTYSAATLAPAIIAALERADPTPTWNAIVGTINASGQITSDMLFTLLTGTGANLSSSIWSTIGFNTGADTANLSAHGADTFVVYNGALYSFVAIVGDNVSPSGTVRLDAGPGLNPAWGAAAPFTTNVPAGTAGWQTYFAEQAYQAARILITDVSNPAGYNALGVLYVGTYGQPEDVEDINYGDDREHLSEIRYAVGGAQNQLRRGIRGVHYLNWKIVSQSDHDLFREMEIACPVGSPFFIALDAVDDPARIMYGFLRRGLRMQWTDGTYWAVPIEFAEVMP